MYDFSNTKQDPKKININTNSFLYPEKDSLTDTHTVCSFISARS